LLTRVWRQANWLFHCRELNFGWSGFFSLATPFFSYSLFAINERQPLCYSFMSGTINFDFLMHSRPSSSINCFFFVPLGISWIWLQWPNRDNHVIILFFFFYQIKNRPGGKCNNTPSFHLKWLCQNLVWFRFWIFQLWSKP